MDDRDERDLTSTVFCPNCGAPNASQDPRCRSCGAWLGGQGQVIDVTTGEPEPVESPDAVPGGWQGRVQTMTFDRGRVVVAQGGSRTCLLVALAGLVLSCCVCWVLWNGMASIF